jgi:hypothetical protein
MGIRIHTVIGWGIEASVFNKISTVVLPDECEDINEYLYNVFSDCTRLIVPQSERKGGETIIITSNLLSKEGNGRSTEFVDDANSLFREISNVDGENRHYVFMPNAYYAEKWFRYDDSIDYSFARWANGNQHNSEPDIEDYIKYVPQAHYPWTNDRDVLNPDAIPVIPSEIRWYLKHLGIMDDEGIDLLRPIVARWWT